MRPKILVITPVQHINGVKETLESFAEVTYLEDPSLQEVIEIIEPYDSIFTNPNKSKVYIGPELIDAAKNLKVICTASTGTNHIDKDYASKKRLPILALTEEREVINRISSTAELAFTLTMVSLRHVVRSHNKALDGEWDYTNYIGRQMNCLTIGVIGYGRLGKMYSNYCKAFGSRVIVYDPYKRVNDSDIEQVDDLDILLTESDVISIHVHVTDETQDMLNDTAFRKLKSDALIVNTSRGDIVNELDLVAFLEKNPDARIATDVIADELRNRLESPLLKYAQKCEQVTITQHIGGMSREAQEIAYGHAATRLKDFFVSTA
jgi:phosphoglycerate dehydrogenase-like enzyme|tara:strand:- start:120 stop:1082 length:963 start_codon:yes stop_codon:yes gene_type:complete